MRDQLPLGHAGPLAHGPNRPVAPLLHVLHQLHVDRVLLRLVGRRNDLVDQRAILRIRAMHARAKPIALLGLARLYSEARYLLYSRHCTLTCWRDADF